MLHNAAARAEPGSNDVTRLGSLRVTLAMAAMAVTPAIVFAGPIPGLPDLPSPNPAPQPQPQPAPQPPPQGPAPGTDDSTYGKAGQPPKLPASPRAPYAYSGPTGRARLGGVW